MKIKHYLFALFFSDQNSPKASIDMRREHAADKRVGSRVERCQRLDERRQGYGVLRVRYVVVYLEQVKYYVRRPAQHENWKINNKINNKTMFYISKTSW